MQERFCKPRENLHQESKEKSAPRKKRLPQRGNKKMKKVSKTKIEKRLRGKENPRLRKLIITLKKQKQPFWHQVAKELASPKRKAAQVNIFKLSKHAKDKETIIVPGKVLSAGSISKQVRVAAFSFSKVAREKIKHAGGSAVEIEELLKSPDKTARILR